MYKKAVILIIVIAVVFGGYIYWYSDTRILPVERLNAIGSAQEIRAFVMKYHEIDKKHGLDVSFTARNPGDLERSVISGEFQGIAAMSPFAASNFRREGHKLLIHAPEIAMTYHIAVRADSPYQSIVDLKGRTLGILPKVTAAYQSVAVILESSFGINPNAYFRITFGSIPETVELLRNGRVEASILSYPLAAPLFASGEFRSVGYLGDLWVEQEGLVHPFVVNVVFEDWLKSRLNRKILARWIEANNETVRLMLEHPEVITEESNIPLREYLTANGIDTEEEKRLLRENIPTLLYATWDESDIEAMRRVLVRAKELGYLPKDAPTEMFLHPSDVF